MDFVIRFIFYLLVSEVREDKGSLWTENEGRINDTRRDSS